MKVRDERKRVQNKGLLFRADVDKKRPVTKKIQKTKRMRGMGFEPKNSYETRPST